MERRKDRRSTFKKCDLHLHSSSCYSRTYSKEYFFNRLLSEDLDLDVVAVTDHNSVDTQLLHELDRELSLAGIILLGGVELNVRLKDDTVERNHLLLSSGRKGRYFHGIVWCDMSHVDELSEMVDSLMLESNVVSREDVEGVKSGAVSRKEFSARTKGKAIYLEDMQSKLVGIPHFFTFHENKGDRNLSDYLPNKFAANRDYKDRLFYYSHALAVEGGEPSRMHISGDMAEQINATVSALFFSDANEDDVFIGEKYTWIDFDGTIESLLLAVSDPESRIVTSDRCAELPQKNVSHYLESVSFDLYHDEDAPPDNVTLNFVPGYNGIVGSRGSGKSMLARILARKNVEEDYGRYISGDSIRYKLSGEPETATPPKFLYLGQGELESIFHKGDYATIPFLEDSVASIKDSARARSELACQAIEDGLATKKRLLEAFLALYSTGPVYFDHFENGEPSGVSIETPEMALDAQSDSRTIDIAKQELDGIADSIKQAIEKSDEVDFEAVYPENAKLFAALSNEISQIKKSLNEDKLRTERLYRILEKIDPVQFKMRGDLIESFFEAKRELNSAGDSSARASYLKRSEDALAFLMNLLKVRLAAKAIDETVESEYASMLTPTECEVVENDGDCIMVMPAVDEYLGYAEQVNALLSQKGKESPDPLIQACLACREMGYVQPLFNRNKVRVGERPTAQSYIDKYIDLLRAGLVKPLSLTVKVQLNGKYINEMSPGSQAEVLLKMFLHDGLAEEGDVYVILDQPEDNLDAQTIKEFLIDRIKKLKLETQFFIVSHSAPVIVNGDARELILCETRGGSISYHSGTLSDDSMKQAVADVLDGGERYLKMRLNKYNFQVGDQR